jgi:hypothetical protein
MPSRDAGSPGIPCLADVPNWRKNYASDNSNIVSEMGVILKVLKTAEFKISPLLSVGCVISAGWPTARGVIHK